MENKNDSTKKISLFAIGFFGIYILVLFISIFEVYNLLFELFEINLLPRRLSFSLNSNVILNYLIYLISFIIMAPIIGRKAFQEIIYEFKISDNIKEGIAYGVILIAAQLIYNNVIATITPVTENVNQSGVDSIIMTNPFLAFITVGIIGPVVEEITYRYGLFGFCKKKSRLLAYIVTIIIFALIHFEFSTDPKVLLNELLNLPSYLIGAIVLSIAYDKTEKLSVSIIAHIFNNAFSVLMTILASLLI